MVTWKSLKQNVKIAVHHWRDLALAAKAYSATEQVASTLHAMDILQVHQAKALEELHDGNCGLRLMQELRKVTNFALWETLGSPGATSMAQPR